MCVGEGSVVVVLCQFEIYQSRSKSKGPKSTFFGCNFFQRDQMERNHGDVLSGSVGESQGKGSCQNQVLVIFGRRCTLGKMRSQENRVESD